MILLLGAEHLQREGSPAFDPGSCTGSLAGLQALQPISPGLVLPLPVQMPPARPAHTVCVPTPPLLALLGLSQRCVPAFGERSSPALPQHRGWVFTAVERVPCNNCAQCLAQNAPGVINHMCLLSKGILLSCWHFENLDRLQLGLTSSAAVEGKVLISTSR